MGNNYWGQGLLNFLMNFVPVDRYTPSRAIPPCNPKICKIPLQLLQFMVGPRKIQIGESGGWILIRWALGKRERGKKEGRREMNQPLIMVSPQLIDREVRGLMRTEIPRRKTKSEGERQVPQCQQPASGPP